jgi:hypothetical protein
MVEDPRQGVLDALVLSQRCRAMRTNSVSVLQTTPSLTVADGPRSDTPDNHPLAAHWGVHGPGFMGQVHSDYGDTCRPSPSP